MFCYLLVLVLGIICPAPVLAVHLISNSFGQPFLNATYDFVVVGGGTAGLAIASRLAEDFSVAVIEAGGFYEIDNGNGSVIPGLAGGQFVNTSPDIKQPLIDWDFVTEPQDGAGGRRIRYARGKTLGGCSARNYMAYQRPTRESMQMWADQVGDESYTWERTLPYFKKTANIHEPEYGDGKRQKNGTAVAQVDASDDALDGPLHLTWPKYAEPLGTWLQEAFARSGIPLRTDGFSNGALLGHGWPTAAIHPERSTRETSYTSYLKRAMRRTNIKVYHRTMAKRILFKDEIAHGVLVETSGIEYTLSVTKEVILSAGTFQSPQLLMLSGIGPRSTLEKQNIPVLRDAPGVGQNLQDHPFITINFRIDVDTISRFFRDPAYLHQANEQFLKDGSGPLSSPFSNWAWEKARAPYFNISASAMRELEHEFPADAPNVEYIPIGAYVGDYTGKQIDLLDGTNSASLFVVLHSPLSRGSVSISSASALDPPVIDPNWISNPVDVEVLIQGFKRARQIVQSIPEIIVGDETWPGLKVQSDEQIHDAIKRGLGMVYHAACTCKMGKASDEMSVVDTNGRVHGIDGLRVVDASILPFLPPGHPMATVYMLAEKIADRIKNELGKTDRIATEGEGVLRDRDDGHWILEAPHDEL